MTKKENTPVTGMSTWIERAKGTFDRELKALGVPDWNCPTDPTLQELAMTYEGAPNP